MPLSLRVKLWLGRITDWDKDGVRLVLVVIAINVALFGYGCVIEPVLFPDPPGLTESQRNEIRDQFKERLTPSAPTQR